MLTALSEAGGLADTVSGTRQTEDFSAPDHRLTCLNPEVLWKKGRAHAKTRRREGFQNRWFSSRLRAFA